MDADAALLVPEGDCRQHRGFLVRDGERYVVNSCVAELDCNHRLNATQAIAFTSRILQSLIELSKALNRDADLRPRWQELLDRMSPVPLVTVDGQRCLSFSEDDPSVTANGAPYPLQSFYPACGSTVNCPRRSTPRNLIAYLYRHNEIGKGDVFRAHFFTWLCRWRFGAVIPPKTFSR